MPNSGRKSGKRRMSWFNISSDKPLKKQSRNTLLKFQLPPQQMRSQSLALVQPVSQREDEKLKRIRARPSRPQIVQNRHNVASSPQRLNNNGNITILYN